jgi:2,4-dienoyl-CoA reductase (NADPH2)
MLTSKVEVEKHRRIRESVHGRGGKTALQILHTGRYGYHEQLVAPSAIQAPINFFRPHALTGEEIEMQIADFASCARLARAAGYDGVEIMGSENYFINQFIAPRTNQRYRTDVDWEKLSWIWHRIWNPDFNTMQATHGSSAG